jgi:hypothetical protein
VCITSFLNANKFGEVCLFSGEMFPTCSVLFCSCFLFSFSAPAFCFPVLRLLYVVLFCSCFLFSCSAPAFCCLVLLLFSVFLFCSFFLFFCSGLAFCSVLLICCVLFCFVGSCSVCRCSARDWERSGLLGGIPRVVVQISALL